MLIFKKQNKTKLHPNVSVNLHVDSHACEKTLEQNLKILTAKMVRQWVLFLFYFLRFWVVYIAVLK